MAPIMAAIINDDVNNHEWMLRVHNNASPALSASLFFLVYVYLKKILFFAMQICSVKPYFFRHLAQAGEKYKTAIVKAGGAESIAAVPRIHENNEDTKQAATWAMQQLI